MTNKISEEEIRKLAELSRITSTDDEVKKFTTQFDDILNFLDQISEVEIDENDIKRDFKNLNTFREDEILESKNKEEIFGEFPEKEDKYLKVKKILPN